VTDVAARQPTRERGSVLMLMPAAVLIVLLLGAIAVDSAITYLGQRQAYNVAFDAANDAAGAGFDLDAARTSGDIVYDADRVEALAAQAVAAAGIEDLELVSARADGDGVVVTVRRRLSTSSSRHWGTRRVTCSRSPLGPTGRYGEPFRNLDVSHVLPVGSLSMVIAVRTEEADDGLVVVKEARSDGDVVRLTHEAAMLARCRHPGVVDLLGVDERAIRLRHAGTALSRLGPFPADHAAGIVCAVADVVNALHRLGVVHGDIEAAHVLLDERGRPRLCGFGQATERTDDGAADDVAAIGRLLGTLLRAGGDLAWARPPGGVRGSARQRQARKELGGIVAQATRERRDQRLTARQLSKAVHAAVPGCSLPEPSTPTGSARPWFAELPRGIDPTADLAWSDEDLSWLAAVADDDRDAGELAADAGPYAGLGALDQLEDDGTDEDWAALAAAPEAVTGPLPVLAPPEEGPRERARIEHELAPPPPPGPSVPLPPRVDTGEPRRRLPLGRAGLLLVVLAIGVVGGVAGARAVRPLGSHPASASDPDPAPTGASEEATTMTSVAPSTTEAAAPAVIWPQRCEVPEPTGPDVDGDGCPETITVDGRTAQVGTVTVALGQDGDLVALGDWHCDGVATPALLRPDTGEVFVFAEWSLDDVVEVPSVAAVPGATEISAGAGECPALVLTTPDGRRTVELPS
jgi:tRNA A-37 threonylcarbamoyl transferase component Bud32